MNKQNRNTERILLLGVSVLISFLFFRYYSNIKSFRLDEVSQAYQEKRTINLSEDFSDTDFKNIIKNGDYFSDEVYENYLTQKLSELIKQNGPLNNLGQLNKKPYLVEAEEVKRLGGKWGQFRYLLSATKIGLDSALLADIDVKYTNLPASISINSKVSDISISGEIKDDSKSRNPVPNVLVRLSQEVSSKQRDSIKDDYVKKAKYEDLVNINLDNIVKEPVFYVRTDDKGKFSFNNLQKGKNYSVIPITKGKEYGVIRGQGNIQESETYHFTEKTHTLPLFDTYAYNRVKTDKVFTVRTPEEFTKTFWRSLVLFLFGFWILHLSLSLKNRDYDQIILPILMTITGVGLVVLFAIQDPLSDTEFASDTAIWSFGVLVVFAIIAFTFNKKWLKNIVRFNYLETGIFSDNKLVQKSLKKNSRGFAWLVLSFVVVITLAFFGSGPEGSGVKVNLGPIQVSEVAKYLMIIFFAKYFSANLNTFREIPNNRWLLLHSIGLLIGFGTLILIYAVVLGDLGPALVLCITFMIFYSLAKNEFLQMVLAGVVFAVGLMIINYFSLNSDSIILLFVFISLIGLAVYAFIRKKNESMLFLISIISSFILMAKLPFSFAKRLADRNSMFINIWDNSLHGGDQVAQGIWSIDSGGFFGQGLGYGFSNVMPAYHTDMIFESIGEELGIVFLIFLLFLFGILFWRCMLVARKTGDKLLFYLVNGIAIATLVQLSIIVAGSLGLIPLTGIAVPFLSMGKSSLLINLFFFLSVILISQYRGGKYQMEEIENKFEYLNLYVLLSFFSVIIIFTIALFRYWYNADSDMVTPVKVLSKQGEWMLSENPRIKIFADKLKPGNVYDRNGILLATSDRQDFLDSEDDIAGYADYSDYSKQKNSRIKRYYPFGQDLIYWLGDWNNQLVTNENLGYVADFRLISKLRGFENKKPKVVKAVSNQFQELSYLPYETKESNLLYYDRSDFVPYMKAGINSPLIEEFNKQDKNVKLSLDVKMNQMINKTIRNLDNYKDFKISVVALNPTSGEVLASSMNPKPDYDLIKKMNAIPSKYYQKLSNAYFGYNHFVADKDLGMFETSIPGSVVKPINAIAYLNKNGADSINKTYHILASELIRPGAPSGNVNLRNAIINSSNVYFVKLLNESNIDEQLFDLYNSVGISMFGQDKDKRTKRLGGYFIEKSDAFDELDIKNNWSRLFNIDRGLNYNNPKFYGTVKRNRQSNLSFAAWGQEPIQATPLQMARLYGAISQKGELKDLKFIVDDTESSSKKLIEKDVNKVSEFLSDALLHQTSTEKLNHKLGVEHRGKTGTPQRRMKKFDKNKNKVVSGVYEDGWYISYVYSNKYKSPIVFAVRINGKYGQSKGSGKAVEIYETVFKALQKEYFYN